MSRTPPPGRLERAARGAIAFARALQQHDAFEVAGSIAFWFFLSLVPLLVLLGYVVASVARARGMDELFAPIFEVVPPATEGLIRKEIERLAGPGAGSVAPVGFIGFLWTSSSGVHNMMDAFERSVGARRRAWWQQRTIAVLWVIVGLATACLVAWVLVKFDATMRAGESALRQASLASQAGPAGKGHVVARRVHKALHTPREQVLAAVLLLATGASLLAGLYRFAVEHPAGVRRRVWPGALAAIASWLGVSWGFGTYATSIADYAVYYGGLAAVAVLLMWLYLSSLSLIVGAEVNAQLEGVRRPAR